MIVEGDDLAALMREALRGLARPGDVVAIAETAVAIAQGRFIGAETIRPSRLARVAGAPRRRARDDQSARIAAARDRPSRRVARARRGGRCTSRARAIGRRGVFYELLGEAIAAIDGYTGTLPPYERAIVLGPAEPDRVSAELAAALELHVAIVDANDLRRAKVARRLAAGRARRGRARAARQPAGNGDEQTPLVILAWRGTGPHPLVRGRMMLQAGARVRRRVRAGGRCSAPA